MKLSDLPEELPINLFIVQRDEVLNLHDVTTYVYNYTFDELFVWEILNIRE